MNLNSAFLDLEGNYLIVNATNMKYFYSIQCIDQMLLSWRGRSGKQLSTLEKYIGIDYL